MLLTNWLANVTSRLRKRPVFRSRDRRALRQRWQTALSNQISTTEVLEDRTLLTTFNQGELLPAAPHNGDLAGNAVAVDGNWMVVGAQDTDIDQSGAVYLYARNDQGTPENLNDDTWNYHSTLLSPNIVSPAVDYFGASVDIDGDTLIVSAPQAEDGATIGSAYIFKLDDNNTPGMGDDSWNYAATLSRSAGVANNLYERFGWGDSSVAISGNTAVVGAEWDANGSGFHGGAVYVYTTDNDWASTDEYKFNAGATIDPQAEFGASVGISADESTIIVGARNEFDYGAAYIFDRVDNGPGIADDSWTQVKRIQNVTLPP